MPRKPLFKDKEIIIEKAFELIKNQGFNNFTTRNLAHELNVSKNAVFNYFNNKEEIINKVIDKFYNILNTQIIKIISENKDYYKDNLMDIFILYADILYDMVLENGDIYKLVVRDNINFYENNISTEEKYIRTFPIYDFLYENFSYEEHMHFTTQDTIDKRYILTLLMDKMFTVELNRKSKTGKDEFMRLYKKAFYMITEENP